MLQPWVMLQPLNENQPDAIMERIKRKRGKRNKRLFFKRIKQHYPSQCHKRIMKISSKIPKKPKGPIHGLATEGTIDFEGFAEDEIALSSLKSMIASASFEDHFMEATTRQMTVLSIPLNHRSSPNFVFKVLPLQRRPLRVLSLFDGLSTALHILKNLLGINIEIYFSCEIDEDALDLQRENFFGQLIQLGDVRRLDEGLQEKKSNTLLDSLGRIDLLLGGPPCSDLTRLNPNRKGLLGTGSSGNLTLSFCRIRDYLMERSRLWDSQLFWLFENTNHLDTKDKTIMLKALKCQPVECCASSLGPSPRNRIYAGNIPMLEINCKRIQAMTPVNLQDVVGPSKRALVEKVPTITSKGFSRKTGAPMLLPIEVHGKKSRLSAIDFELLLGFPKKFTDNGGLTPNQRQALLGRSWSVPVVRMLLEPLADIFQCGG